MRLDRFIQKIISDSSKNLKERVYAVLTMAAIVACAVALLGDLIYHENVIEIIVLIITTIGVPLVTFMGIRSNRFNLSVGIVSFGLIFAIIPVVFYFGGGTQGAVVPWMIFAYLYFNDG